MGTRAFLRFFLFFITSLSAFAGFHIQSGLLIDNNGNEFILRGINYPHVWYPTQTATSIPNIAATGANCVRVVLGAGKQWGPNTAADVTQVITLCKANKLIPILEVHDCTGFGDVGGFSPNAVPVSDAVDYWISIQSALKGQENFVIINIANEPLGNGVPASTWIAVHTDAVTRLRQAGFTHTLMIDGANWGQDYDQIMLTNASTVFNSDPLKNVLFSVHMYQVYALRSTILNYLTTFMSSGLPLVVGEFGPDNGGAPADAVSVMELSQTLGVGYMGWSWSGNSGGTESLDIALNFNPTTLSPWGNLIINGVNGIAATSQLASVFGNVPTLQLSPTTLSPAAAGGSAVVSVKSNQSWTASTAQTWISLSPAAGTGDGGITVTTTANPGTGPRTGTVTLLGGGLTRKLTVTQVGTGGAGVCNNPVSIQLPFVQDGLGEFCWVTSGDLTSINSWNVQSIEINGVSITNKFANSFPPKIQGNYYIHYVSALPWGHFEAFGNNSSTTVPVTGVSLAPTTVTLNVGATTTLAGTIAPSNATNKALTWTSSNPSIATVNASGVVTGLVSGSAIITVTTQNGGFTATTAVSVVNSIVPVTGVSVSPATASVTVGASTPLAATVLPANATNKSITWTSSVPAIATVNASGVVTGVSAGTATITATTQSGGFTAKSTVTVTNATVTPCANPTAITLPFAQNGIGEFCWVTSGTVSYINSWNMQKVEINGVDFTNKWANTLPAKIGGNYYIHYVANVPWAHLEVNGSP